MKTNPNAFTTNFSHRLNAELDASPARLHDCMNPVLGRLKTPWKLIWKGGRNEKA